MTDIADKLDFSSMGVWRPTTALPEEVRAGGKVPNFDAWHPGDLILTKSADPDLVSQQITKIQTLGYGDENSSWTHAAVYLGDGLMLCEAQFDPPDVCSVIVARLLSYVASHELRVRRSVHAESKELGWAIATAAATKIGDQYDWKFIAKLAAQRAFVGDRIWQYDRTGMITAGAFVCSSLYSTAHAYVTDVTITDKLNGLCVPAYLAGESKHLRDVEWTWRKIA